MQALHPRIEHQQDSPGSGKFEPRDDRRRHGRGRPPAVDDDAAAFEEADADAGALAAVKRQRVARHVGRQALKMAQRAGEGERQLRAGAKPDVIGDRLVNGDAIGGGQVEALRQHVEIGGRAQRLDALHEGLRRRRDGEARDGMVDRKPDAAEAPAKSAVEVEKAEVKPGRGDGGDAFKHEVSFAGLFGDLRQGHAHCDRSGACALRPACSMREEVFIPSAVN